jgi:hypothetical protein
MNSPTRTAFASNHASGAGEAEETLRIIAGLPAPEGLEDRVAAALRGVPRTARILPWPAVLAPTRRWMKSSMARSAAAAAIVFVVVGGGWGVYTRVQPVQAPRVVAMPRVAAPGGFSSAGAMRTPQTLNGPVLAHPVTPTHESAAAANKKQVRTPNKQQRKSSRVAEPKKVTQ